MANRPVRVNERPALTGHQYRAPSKVSVMERAHWVEAVGGNCTRLFFEHGGFELDQESEREAFNRMGPGWRDQMLPQLAQTAAQLTG